MPRSNVIHVDDKVIYIDEFGVLKEGVCTNVWGDEDKNPTINIRVDDVTVGSVQHRSATDAPGRYWMFR